jgi:protein-histidine N-methyltransferase
VTAYTQQLDSLPERISYNTIKITSPLGKTAHIPRRELFDVRVQLMAEDAEGDQDHVIDQLQKSDLRAGVYEGGFKTWESSIDLASLLLDRGPRKDVDELGRCDSIVELGAGTALPSLILWRHCLVSSLTGMTFTFADFNEEVLRLVTLPNVLLTFALATLPEKFLAEENNSTDAEDGPGQGELEITTELKTAFLSALDARQILLNFLSGPWSPELARCIPESAPDMGLLILAAETIYSPESTAAFVDILAILLSRVKMAKAMVGAKRLYFGVGGSVDGLKEACRDRGAVAYEVENHGVVGMDAGVGRALVEIQMY